MRIVVDEMPKSREYCDFVKDESTMDYDEYTCKYMNSNIHCPGPEECPYFVSIKTMHEVMKDDDEYDSHMAAIRREGL